MQPFVETTIIGALDPCRMPASLVIDLMEEIFSSSSKIKPTQKPSVNDAHRTEGMAHEATCPCQQAPEACLETNGSWRALRIKRKCHVPTSVTLTRLMQPLSVCGLDIMVASKKDGEYVMIKEDDLPRAIDILRIAGHRIQTLAQSAKTSRCYNAKSPKNSEQCTGGCRENCTAQKSSPATTH